MNLGSDREISINDLAKMTIELTGSGSAIRHVPYSVAYGEGFEDMQRRVPCLERARRLIQYQPRFTLEDIIHDLAAELQGEAQRAGLPGAPASHAIR
jgi:UDP-glucose 4-epimerase